MTIKYALDDLNKTLFDVDNLDDLKSSIEKMFSFKGLKPTVEIKDGSVVIEIDDNTILNVLKDYNKATRLAEKGKLDLALELFQKVVEKCPLHAESYRNIAQIKMLKKDYDGAIDTLDLVKECFTCGIASKNFAIVTPYRRQVKAIRERVRNICSLTDGQDLPLIDTVERLQGQDVDMIIISLCTTDPDHLSKERSFIYNENRMNVMISRAKRKVVLLRKLLATTCMDVLHDSFIPARK